MSSARRRDCKAWKDEKLALSTTSNEAAKLFDDVLTQYVTWTENQDHEGIEGTLKKMLESDPDFVMGNVLSVGLELMATGRTIRLDNDFANNIVDLEKRSLSTGIHEREKLHCKAVLQFAREEYTSACETWEDILVEHPNDLLALKFAHDSYFYLGNSVMIRDSVGRVLPYWKSTDPLYGYLKGMYAFGLEEMNIYNLAEKYSREALAANVNDCWATHALAHCFEMTGRASNGIDFMSNTENNWNKGAMLACHNYWHWALYYIENGQYEEALDLYDQQVGQRVHSGATLDIVDAASLLKRLEFQGVGVGDRWNGVYEICRPHIDDHIMVFNDIHFLLTYLGARKTKDDVVEQFIDSVKNYVKTSKGTNCDVSQRVGLKLFDAAIAYSEERFDDAVELLYPVKNQIVSVGGSHAQRDLFSQLLLQACIQSKNSKNIKLGKALLHERKLLKENSPLTDRMMNKLLTCHT